ncbi:hypothetical protein HHL16_17675 [Pseudoflavitalea sp. G-6-1-2]|uniref:hypothetical protein n=1 Tax=Pseudoflavitalea sp. G-6-1-2 TaxID=2728841 RepID=UPI00146F8428|nr:hypothetical protein [Pseudoflavitalea sp. G-6-1-2]NML22718.1 hypothetical protein [Pseudoflavitalea sp. G-6-1-2]
MYKPIQMWMLLLTAATCLAVSCSKSKQEDPETRKPVAGQLAVVFDNKTIPFSLIDSGYVVLRKDGNQLPYIKKFIKEKDKLQITIDDLTPGNYTASLYVDAHLEDNNKVIYREYRMDKQFKAGNDGIEVSGPTTSWKKDWKPHVVFTNETKEFYAYVPLIGEDPTFEIIRNNKKWTYFYIERAAHERKGATNKLLSGFSYQCSDCFGNSEYLYNKTAFKNWSTELANYSWNNGVIVFMIMDQETGEDIQYPYVFDRPDLQ